MYISIHDLGLIVLFILALFAGIYLIITLKNLNRILIIAKDFLKRNSESLDNSIILLPETLKYTNEMAQSIKHQVDEVGTTISTVGTGISETVATINDKADTGITMIKSVGEVIQILIDVFKKSKE